MCDNKFHVSKKSIQRFCSTKCQGRWQSKQLKELNPRYNRILCQCDNCGKELNVKPSDFKRYNHNFCNDDCRKIWYSNVFSQSEEWKNISRERAAKLLKNNKTTCNTKPQIIINNLLNQLHINYINEYVFKYYSVDNYLQDYNLIIEVMGDFWHCNPTKYNTIQHKIQKKRVPKDKAKHTYIKNQHSIEILYIWENDIYKNLSLCEKLIQLYIENDGKLESYNSFNYNIKNNDLYICESNIISHFGVA